LRPALSLIALLAATAFSAFGQSQDQRLVHGLWVWKGPAVLEAGRGAENLRDFCRRQGIDDVYISLSPQSDPASDARFAQLIALLHRSGIGVEALLSSTDADQPGKHREKLLDHVRSVIEFNQSHGNDRFDGVHLDIEPQQRPENKGEGNLGFLPGLVDAYRAVRALAEPAGLTIDADIQNKLLKADAAQRRMLLSSLPRLTLMLYELSGPDDGQSPEQKMDKLRLASQKYLDMAFDGLDDPNLATLAIGLRTPDYGDLLPQMLASLDIANRANPHYAGWSRHSYNDALESAK
jgi:hypothetical protein